jgi:phosphatidylglycerophosphate synthase
MVGLSAALSISLNYYAIGFILILINRIFDGLDGIVARETQTSDKGAFLDISLDFVFYAMIPMSFAINDPDNNSLAAIYLIVSFVGTGSSFLAFSLVAERRNLKSMVFPKKGIYYLESFMEGGETIFFFLLMCLIPSFFPIIAYVFTLLCTITWLARLWIGFKVLKK